MTREFGGIEEEEPAKELNSYEAAKKLRENFENL
jgi:hypothetical protein